MQEAVRGPPSLPPRLFLHGRHVPGGFKQPGKNVCSSVVEV